MTALEIIALIACFIGILVCSALAWRVLPVWERHRIIDEPRPMNRDEAFYAKFYDSDVHRLHLIVTVPAMGKSESEALDLVREVLDDASFDISVELADNLTNGDNI